jgi:hypothetical protein
MKKPTPPPSKPGARYAAASPSLPRNAKVEEQHTRKPPPKHKGSK